MSEPTRLPVFLRAWRSGLRVCAIAVMLVMLVAGSAMAKIGESYSQVIQEAQHDKDAVAITPWDFNGRTALTVQYQNEDVIYHLFDAKGKEIEFFWYANHEVTWKEVGVVQRIFKTKWERTQINPEWTSWESTNGLGLAVQGKVLHIFNLKAVQQLLAKEKKEEGLKPALEFAQAQEATPAEEKKDCLPFAIEALSRLKKSSVWAQIAGFTWVEDGKKLGGHAVVFFQPTEKSNVWMYDRSGSYDLQTRSHDLGEIIAALNSLTRDNLSVESPRWLESDDSRTEFASSASKEQPRWLSNADTKSPNLTLRILGGLVSVVIGLFVLGFTLQILGWIIAIVCYLIAGIISVFRWILQSLVGGN